ncbi:MAG: carbohydrate ABC transporter permease [Planctomycetota bacterium]|jgi:ABC-type glycerol-3-phosphate transport system permease component
MSTLPTTLGVSVTGIGGIVLLLYCLISIAILWAYARTRWYPLYVLKCCWVGVTIIGFIWIISMSFADPGPKHGGVASEYLNNPAGPFAALGDYAHYTRRLYYSSPWWLFLLTGLLILWRGLVGHRESDRDTSARRMYTLIFMAAAVVVVLAVLVLVDWGRGSVLYLLSGAFRVLVLCGIWAVTPLEWKRWASRWALLAMGVLIALPLVASLAKFDWSSYTYAAGNYAFAWKTARMGNYMLNSVMVSLMTVGVTTVCASMAAYALTRFEFTGRTVVLLGFIGAMVIPAQLYIVPLFLMVQDWHVSAGAVQFSFMDSRTGLSLIYAAAGLPFATFLLTGFYRTLPGTLREAASIDGCGEWQTFTDVYFPLAVPGLATAAIFQFLGVWNEYQFALVFLTNDKLKTLPVGLYNLSVSQQYAANWSALFAGVTILCLPTFLIFVILQERIVAGLTVGAVKE